MIVSTRELKVLSRFDYDPGDHPGIVFTEPSMTQQQFADESNINNIIARFKETGTLSDDPDPNNLPVFDDFTVRSAYNYQTAMNVVVRAREQFDALPSNIRERFGYSPKALLQFLGDESNYDEAVRLGLVRPREPEPTLPEPVPPAPSSNADQ